MNPGASRRRLWLSALPLLALLAFPGPASALVEAPVTVDGPDPSVIGVRDTAMADGGSGAVVYLKTDAGVPHVFVVRRMQGGWSLPVRVDRLPYEASQPRVAAGERGRLLVVWVSQIRTVHGAVRRALYSAELGPHASSFDEPLVVDPNLGEGRSIESSLAGTEPGRAIVAYRVTTFEFPNPIGPAGQTQLAPGDVLAEVRVARYQGTRWSRLGAINRNPEASLPPATPAAGPQVALANDGTAVVAWLERDQTGTARIWARRVFGTAPGPAMPASPDSWEGKPVSDGADGLALAVSPFGMAQVVSRIVGSGGSTRLFSNQLPPRVADAAAEFTGPALIAGPLTGPVGTPAVAVVEAGKKNGTRFAYSAGGTLHTATAGSAAPLADPAPGPPPAGGSEVALAASVEGSSLAWPTTGRDGLPAVAVRQEQSEGRIQTGLLAGAEAGEVSGLSIAGDEGGDAILGFLQTAGTDREVVADAITGPPSTFSVIAPRGWVRPAGARLRWTAPASAALPVTYTVLLDGDPVASLTHRSFLPAPAALGNGVSRLRVMATDAQHQTTVSAPTKLRVDSRPPTATVRRLQHAHRPHTVLVKLEDRDSGVAGGATVCAFGDGDRRKHGRVCRHSYARPGLYEVRVKAQDRAGNATTIRIPVSVR